MAPQEFSESGQVESERLLERVGDLVPDHDVVVEIECGTGRLVVPHARVFDSALGVDISPSMLKKLVRMTGRLEFLNTCTIFAMRRGCIFLICVLLHRVSTHTLRRCDRNFCGANRCLSQPGGDAQHQFDTRPRSLAVLYPTSPSAGTAPQAHAPYTSQAGVVISRLHKQWT